MAALPLAVVLSLAGACAPDIDPHLIAGIALRESRLDPSATHRNANGTEDVGLMQINEKNFGWLGLTRQTALDPCASIAAGARVLMRLSAYNTGSSINGIANGYAPGVLLAVGQTKAPAAAKPAETVLAGQISSFTKD